MVHLWLVEKPRRLKTILSTSNCVYTTFADKETESQGEGVAIIINFLEGLVPIKRGPCPLLISFTQAYSFYSMDNYFSLAIASACPSYLNTTLWKML